MRLRFPFSSSDWAIILGAALMMVSALGWYIDTPRPERPVEQVQPSAPALALQPALVIGATGTAVPLSDLSSNDFLVPVNTPMAEAVDQPAFDQSGADQPPADGPSQAQPRIATPTQAAYPPAQAADTSPQGAAPTTAADSSKQPAKLVPDRVVIPAIGLDAPIFPSSYTLVQVDGQVFQQWEAPNSFAAGWQTSSVGLGQPGNTVLLGHNNIDGEVFARLVDLNEGDVIQIHAGEATFQYQVTQKMILLEKEQDLSVRLKNASWLLPSDDERLTLVTCWPQTSNTHRLIVVAKPVGP